jgi:hypothetical protein
MMILKISNLLKLEFDTFDILEKNYLFWTLDAGIYLDLDTNGNRDLIKEENKVYN